MTDNTPNPTATIIIIINILIIFITRVFFVIFAYSDKILTKES